MLRKLWQVGASMFMAYLIGISICFSNVWAQGQAQQQVEDCCLSIKVTDTIVTDATWLRGRPKKVQIGIAWTPEGQLATGEGRRQLGYVVRMSETMNFKGISASDTILQRRKTFNDLEAYKQYYFQVEALDIGVKPNQHVYDTFVEVSFPGQASTKNGGGDDGSVWYVMWSGVYRSSVFGQLAMVLAGLMGIFAIGVIIQNMRVLRGGILFPTNAEVDTETKFQMIIDAINKDLSFPCTAKDRQLIREIIVTREKFYGSKFMHIRGWFRLHFRGKLDFKIPIRSTADEDKDDSLINMPTVRILRAGVSVRASFDSNPSKDAKCLRNEVREAMAARVGAEAEKLNKRSIVDSLWYIGFTEPLLGLFGTVTGLAGAFQAYSQHPGQLSSIATGISEAIATTVWGLLIGVPIMLCYYYFSYKLDRAAADWEIMGVDFSEKC